MFRSNFEKDYKKLTNYLFSFFLGKKLLLIIFLSVLFSFIIESKAQAPVTFPAGTYIINMGVVPQTLANGLKPYGLIYDLIKNNDVPVYWVIGDSKSKDGPDFTYNGVDYKGGTFIIHDDYISTAVASKITSYGVTGAYTTSNLTLTPDYKFTSVPTWTLDEQNGGIATSFFSNAGIPATAYNWVLPAQLGVCNDVFVMPHADPKWATHGNLYNWNLQYKGSIWTGCHALSALENMYNPADINQQTNFLSNKVTTPGTGIILPVPGSTNYAQNSLVLWGNHTSATPPYNTLTDVPGPAPQSGTLATATDPVAQYMGVSDGAHLGGSEKVYLPVLGGSYRTSTKIICYDPTQADVPLKSPGPAVIIAYGRGFGDENRGYVMVEAGHSISGSTPAFVAAQRAFFNWSLLSGFIKVPVITSIDGIQGSYTATPYPQNYTLKVNYFSPVSSSLVKFTWTCRRADTGAEIPGVFSPNGNGSASTTTFTPPSSLSDIPVLISVKIEDDCGRKTFESFTSTIAACSLTATGVPTSTNCFGGTGSVLVTVSGATGTVNYSYSGAASGNGSSATNPFTVSGLVAGTYNFTVTASGCSASFSTLITQPAQLSASTLISNVLCYGGTGNINLSVTGGTAPYTYSWSPGGASTEDLANVSAGSYTVIVTDFKGCATIPAITTATVTQPAAALTVMGSITNVSCFGGTNGAINITASGGTPALVSPFYTYDWADIAGTSNVEDRTGLAAGTYQVVVTDANGCTTTQSFTVTQPTAISLSTVVIQPTCPPDASQNSSDGGINLSVSGGSGNFTYLWTTIDGTNLAGQSANQDLTNLQAGTYTVTVAEISDINCFKTLSVTLNYLNPNPVQPSVINN